MSDWIHYNHLWFFIISSALMLSMWNAIVPQIRWQVSGRPTSNPRTEKIGFRMSSLEIEDIRRCSEAMHTQRVNAVVEGIRLLKEKLHLNAEEK